MPTIYHNPRCSKSRQTLQILQDKGLEITIIEYLTCPPSEQELKNILKLLNATPFDLMRKGEEEYKLYINDKNLSDDEAISVMVKHPRLIERPIVLDHGKAVLGRPPENVLALYEQCI